jgi:hypothetical protein
VAYAYWRARPSTYGIWSCICVNELFSSTNVRTLVGPPAGPEPDEAGAGGADSDVDACDGGDAEDAEPDEHPPTSTAAATAASTDNRWMTNTLPPTP